MSRRRRPAPSPRAKPASVPPPATPRPAAGPVRASRGTWALLATSLSLGLATIVLSLHASAENPRAEATATAAAAKAGGPPASRLTRVEPDPPPAPPEAPAKAQPPEPESPTATVTATATTAPSTVAAPQEVEELRAYNAQLVADLAASRQEHRLALSRLTVADTTREHLATELAQAQAEVSRLRQSVAFYERVIPASGEGQRVQIRSAEVHPLGDNLLQYRVLVMRNRIANETFHGELQFVATGEQDGSSATIPLERLSMAPTSEAGSNPTPVADTAPGLRFQQYQRATGLLAIPPGFTPATITVRVLEGKAIRAEHTVKVAQESLS